mmetsp:Transcript_47438/g.119548  ORF Transcript_47438/g.119548 Transcript_47438/m.119548 type:complete len:89 (+) Transcript_47438:724-990(+)
MWRQPPLQSLFCSVRAWLVAWAVEPLLLVVEVAEPRNPRALTLGSAALSLFDMAPLEPQCLGAISVYRKVASQVLRQTANQANYEFNR